MLWEADFTFLKYAYVDLLHEGSGGALADGGEATPVAAEEVQRAAREAVEQPRSGGIVNMADFDATLYFLDDREIEYLQSEIDREYQQDLRVNIVAACCSTSSRRRPTPTVRGEVLDDLETLMVYLLTAGHFRGVARLLRESSQVARSARRTSRPSNASALAQLAERLSASGRAVAAAPVARRSADASAAREELAICSISFGRPRWRRCFNGSASSRTTKLRPVLDAARRPARRRRTRPSSFGSIQSPDRDVSLEAIRRAGRAKAQAAVLALGQECLSDAGSRASPACRAGAHRDRIAGRAAGARARDRGRRSRRPHSPPCARDGARAIGRRSRVSTRS